MSRKLVSIQCHCGSSVLTPFAGFSIPDWPTLLHLYSRFRAGKTVRDWMEEYDVHKLNIDVRRFTSFGVIKVSSLAQLGVVSCLTLNDRGFCGGFIVGLSYCQAQSKHRISVPPWPPLVGSAARVSHRP